MLNRMNTYRIMIVQENGYNFDTYDVFTTLDGAIKKAEALRPKYGTASVFRFISVAEIASDGTVAKREALKVD